MKHRRRLRFSVMAVALAAGTLAPGSASAQPPLELPWTCAESFPVTNGHHTNTHTGMDAWAWDFGMPTGAEVRAPADGVVRLVKMNSNRGGCNSAYANDANYVVIDFGDGSEALLMHLQRNSSNLSVGQAVHEGDIVGRVGLTGWVCGAHLHFQIQSTCASWWCQSRQASFVGIGDPRGGAPLQSNNCPNQEPCAERLDGTQLLIDDSHESCFERVTSWFWPADEGVEDGHVYTWANDAKGPDTMGVWNFAVDVPGEYLVEAFVPRTAASSELARYEVFTGSQTVVLGPVDQSAHEGWTELGVVDFEAGEERWVRLADNTGEPRDLDRQLAFDAIRISPVPEAAGSTGEIEEGTSDTGEIATTSGGRSTGSGSGDAGDETPTTTPETPSTGEVEARASTGDGGCRLGEPRDPPWALLVFGVVGLTTRRRRCRA